MNANLSRRDLLKNSSAFTGGIAALSANTPRQGHAIAAPGELQAGRQAEGVPQEDRFRFGLNTSTIRGQKLSIVDEIAIASKAGYQAMEPWLDELERYAAGGGSLEDLAKRFRDAAISVESAIGFFEWIVDDSERRRKGVEAAKRGMELVRRIGGKRLAAPPVGATDRPLSDLYRIAERYRVLLEVGDQIGVVPEVEIWGPSKTLGRLGEAAFVAIEAQHPKACILPDVYHLYRGGSDFGSVTLLGPKSFFVLHFNDYPAQPARNRLTDADRVYPGDGAAPLRELLTSLSRSGFTVTLSLELFNRKLWTQDPLAVAKTGLEKMKALLPNDRPGPA
jgi:sugar phosphate isomerase/epimerase